MKAILEEYALIIIVVLCALIMIAFAPSLTGNIKDKWSSSINNVGVKVSGEEKEVVTNYTLDQINADPNLYAIGETKPEYVVAKFSADGTSVEITKNSKDSDGKMKEFIDRTSFVDITSPMTEKKATLKSADIKKGVTTIGYHSFIECEKLENVKIPNGITLISHRAFGNCISLQDVKIPNSIVALGESCFGNCNTLKTIHIPNSITTIKSFAFHNCNSLTINCEAPSQPASWNSNWNSSNRPVNWGVSMGGK